MRLDKFLKVSRIIKRRTVANDACDAEHVTVNGRRAKASYDVKEGDIIEIAFGAKTLRVRVLDVKEHVLKSGAADLYEVITE
ncbi:MAG: RNA-binding S4 domain-containing protein [Clostridia bacterium]|nr:RNA-binding S4 domain-containing protein [Clostridia bacterium]